MIASPYDLEMRYSQKRSTAWRGYKVHLTETCEADTPNLITHVETTLATVQDVAVVDDIHAGLAKKGLLPDDHLMDGAYLSGDNLVDSRDEYGVDLIGPVRRDKSWQARDENAFDQIHFEIDWANQSVTCPNGKQSRYWKPGKGPRGKPTIQIHFHKQDCLSCPARSRCTQSEINPRQLTLPQQAQYLALESARERQKTELFKQTYAARAGVEGVISQGAFSMDMRHTRYRGLAKTHLQHVATAAAINVQRVVDWLWENSVQKRGSLILPN